MKNNNNVGYIFITIAFLSSVMVFSPLCAFLFLIVIILIVAFKKMKADEQEERETIERIRQEQERQKRLEEEERLERERLNEERRKATEAEKNRKIFLERKHSEFKSAVDAIPLFEISFSEEKHSRNQEIYIVDKEYKNITKATPINKIKDFVAVDVETTGLKTGGNDIIQLSAIKYKDFKAVEAFNTYIKPRKAIPAEATEVNGISDEMVENAPKFYQIIDSFNAFIEDLPLVAHNAPFDIKHLYVNGLDSVENKIVYDTLALSRHVYKEHYSYKLADICELNNIYICNAHNSIYDSYATGELFKSIIEDKKEVDLDDLFSTLN